MDSVEYLYLRELSEPHDNSLKIVVEEAVVNRAGIVQSDPELAAVLRGTSNPDASVRSSAKAHNDALEILKEKQEKAVEQSLTRARVITLHGTNHYVFPPMTHGGRIFLLWQCR